MKTRLVLFLIVLATVLPSAAQTTITGHIADARTGESLIGASVVPKSSKELGAVTDVDGNFTLVTNVEALASHPECPVCRLPPAGGGCL